VTRYKLTVRIEVREDRNSYSGEGIAVTTERQVEASGFLDLARVTDPIVKAAESVGHPVPDRK
jgi:hypothetical protein